MDIMERSKCKSLLGVKGLREDRHSYFDIQSTGGQLSTNFLCDSERVSINSPPASQLCDDGENNNMPNSRQVDKVKMLVG